MSLTGFDVKHEPTGNRMRAVVLATLHSPVLQTVHRGGLGHHDLRLAEMLRLPPLRGDLRLHIGSEMSAAPDDALTIRQPLSAVGRQCGIDIVVARQVIGQRPSIARRFGRAHADMGPRDEGRIPRPARRGRRSWRGSPGR
jgi:hypothetical protein